MKSISRRSLSPTRKRSRGGQRKAAARLLNRERWPNPRASWGGLGGYAMYHIFPDAITSPAFLGKHGNKPCKRIAVDYRCYNKGTSFPSRADF